MEKLLMEVVRTGVRMLKIILHYISHFSVGLSVLSICVWAAGTFLMKQDMTNILIMGLWLLGIAGASVVMTWILDTFMNAWNNRLKRKYYASQKHKNYKSYNKNSNYKNTNYNTKLKKETESENKKAVSEKRKSYQELMNELNDLTGLNSVKKQVQGMINHINVEKRRRAIDKNIVSVKPMYNMIFSGNPGTGKTTVARLLAEIFREIGVVSKGHLIETDRGGLVGQYVGETAQKTREIVESAIGGVLFIDEAYSLYRGESGNDYGQEAIDTLIKIMEDKREDLIVIAAGYKDEMEIFIEANPGLSSRFPIKIDFEDYTSEEMISILKTFGSKDKNSFEAEALAEAYNYFEIVREDYKFSNGREVRNFYEKCIQNRSNRLSRGNYPDEEYFIIRKKDVVTDNLEVEVFEELEYKCPKCEGNLVQRNGKNGIFWGCSNFRYGCRATFSDEDGKPRLV